MVSAGELSGALAGAVEKGGASVVRVEARRRGSASGVVWRPGVVVTAAHAVERTEQVHITLPDGNEAAAEWVGADAATDLAVFKVGTGQAQLAEPAALDEVKVGNLVLALSRPGVTVRASWGIVSALSTGAWRTPGGAELARYLESDAGRLPGGSGGPLVDTDGRVLGLNTSGLVRGARLTVPAETVSRVVEALLQHGKRRQSYLGVNMQPVRLPEVVQEATGEELGLLVLGVEPGGPAEKAGVLFGDTLLHLGPDDVRDLGSLQAFLRADHVGETVPVTLWRAGTKVAVQLTLGERP